MLLERTGQHTSSCFSGDGLWFASAWKKEKIEVYDVENGDLVVSFPAAPRNKRQPVVRSLAMNANGTLLAGAYGNQVVVWDADTGEVTLQFGNHEPPIKAIVFAPNGEHLYVGTGLSKESRCISVYRL